MLEPGLKSRRFGPRIHSGAIVLDCCRFMQTRASKTKASVRPKRGDGDGLKAGLLIPTRGERADEEEHSSSEKTTGVLWGEGKREGRAAPK